MDRAASRRSLRAPQRHSAARGQPLSGAAGNGSSNNSSGSGSYSSTLMAAGCGTPARPRRHPHQPPPPPPDSAGEDLDYVWLDAALTRLRELLELRSADQLTDSVRLLRAEHIRDNLTGCPGPDQADTLPDWVANAVRCLARWPDTGLRSLPSYDGFELDIFAALCEFFESRDPEPLVPYELRDLFVNVLVLADNLYGARAHDLSRERHQQHQQHLHRHRRHHRAGPPAATPQLLAMTTSCAEIMRQIALPASAVDASGGVEAPSPLPLPLLRFRRRRRSSCGPADAAWGRCRRRSRRSGNASGCQSDREDDRGGGAASEAGGLADEIEEGDFDVDVHPIDSDSLLVTGLQVAALFLPPRRRRRLNQLLRVMHRLGSNDRLRLDPLLPTAHVVLHALAGCALRKSPEPQGQPDVFALQLVAFMTAHYSAVFRAPAELRERVEARLADMRALRVSRHAHASAGVGGGFSGSSGAAAAAAAAAAHPPETDRRQFCHRIPAAQFSLAGRLTSDQALLDLLEGLLRDENLPARDKKRKLRLFKESHPHVYSARFPDPDVERSVLDGLRRAAGPLQPQGLLGRTLTALRNLRL